MGRDTRHRRSAQDGLVSVNARGVVRSHMITTTIDGTPAHACSHGWLGRGGLLPSSLMDRHHPDGGPMVGLVPLPPPLPLHPGGSRLLREGIDAFVLGMPGVAADVVWRHLMDDGGLEALDDRFELHAVVGGVGVRSLTRRAHARAPGHRRRVTGRPSRPGQDSPDNGHR